MKANEHSLPHDSAHGHADGGARYVEDLPRLEQELVVDFVPSPTARGVLHGLDLEQARAVDGVVAIWTAHDVAGRNRFGPVFSDEPFLVDKEISYVGQPLAVIAAENAAAARAARRLARPSFSCSEAILSIAEAIRRGSFLCAERRIHRGDPDRALDAAEHDLEGVFHSAGQEQFYLESQAALAWPEEGGGITIHSSTQNPSEIQSVVAEVLGLRQHHVTCLVRRMGGAFGGKETQATLPALMVALAVQKTGRPARIVYSKDDDMKVTGKRHPYRTHYQIGFDREGRVLAAKFQCHSDGGAFADLSTAVLERTMLHLDNAYFLADVSIRAQACRTNLPPNTAFRGFGGPQGMAVVENVMEEIALRLRVDALDVRRINLYPGNFEQPDSKVHHDDPRSLTPYGQAVRNNLLPEIFDRLEHSTAYRRRAREIETFNRRSPTHVRGLAMTPVKFGISFTTKFLNQANALVHVLTDGSVQVSTGATEMGQGVNTKIAQLVAEELGLDTKQVQVLPTSTDRNHNTSPTAASASTDLNGSAALQACRAILGRLADFAAPRLANQQAGLGPSPEHVRFSAGEVFDARAPQRRIAFGELCALARRERVDLGARGFYATPGIDFNRDTGRGTPFSYFTTGCAVAEVLIDRLTGELSIERLETLMDLGRVLNHGIERGQVLGGLLQGVGWVTTEELVYDSEGALLSPSPTTYKIPNASDTPAVFRADFLDNDWNRHNLRSSKAVGEPPLMLGISVWCAIKQALGSIAAGQVPELPLPATHEQILLALHRIKESIQDSRDVPVTARPRGQEERLSVGMSASQHRP